MRNLEKFKGINFDLLILICFNKFAIKPDFFNWYIVLSFTPISLNWF